MNITINVREAKELTNLDKWNLVKNGDYLVLEGELTLHPIPKGIYRVFFGPPDANADSSVQKVIFLCPLFAGSFDEGMFPYSILQYKPIGTNMSLLLPEIKAVIESVELGVEVKWYDSKNKYFDNHRRII